MIADPKARRQFELSGVNSILSGENQVNDVVRARERDARLASLNAVLDGSAKSAVDPNIAVEQHDKLLKSTKDAIDEAVTQAHQRSCRMGPEEA